LFSFSTLSFSVQLFYFSHHHEVTNLGQLSRDMFLTAWQAAARRTPEIKWSHFRPAYSPSCLLARPLLRDKLVGIISVSLFCFSFIFLLGDVS
jgi:hypothetical protein